MSGLEIDIRTARYGAGPAVIEGLRLSVASGEVVALIGPSGVGKTTLLGMLAGLNRQFDGEIGLDGVALEVARPRIGIVFQEPRLLPWLSIRDNIALVLSDPRAEAARIDALLTSVGLKEWADAWPGALSGGMQRRAALARAFAVCPQLLLLDEPFVSLDRPTAHQLRGLLRDLWQSLRPIVVLVSHDLEDALELADRIVFLSAPPARVLLEQRLPQSRAAPHLALRRKVTAHLLKTHPALLSGHLSEPADDGDVAATTRENTL